MFPPNSFEEACTAHAPSVAPTTTTHERATRRPRARSGAWNGGETPDPRGDSQPDTACPAQPAGLRTRGHRPSLGRPGSAPGLLLPRRRFPNLRPSASDGGRSRSPLRDSPGFPPGSLSPATRCHRHRTTGFDIPRTPKQRGMNQLHPSGYAWLELGLQWGGGQYRRTAHTDYPSDAVDRGADSETPPGKEPSGVRSGSRRPTGASRRVVARSDRRRCGPGLSGHRQGVEQRAPGSYSIRYVMPDTGDPSARRAGAAVEPTRQHTPRPECGPKSNNTPLNQPISSLEHL